jgi:hypothetical protein
MASLLDDPEHWRSRAEEARSVVEQLSNPESKRCFVSLPIMSGWPNTVNCGYERNRPRPEEPLESDDHAYAHQQVGENDRGAALDAHGPLVGRMASPVHPLQGFQTSLRGHPASLPPLPIADSWGALNQMVMVPTQERAPINDLAKQSRFSDG